jgi:hypothetical protein
VFRCNKTQFQVFFGHNVFHLNWFNWVQIFRML